MSLFRTWAGLPLALRLAIEDNYATRTRKNTRQTLQGVYWTKPSPRSARNPLLIETLANDEFHGTRYYERPT